MTARYSRPAYKSAASATPRADVYQDVTDKIVAQLEAGVKSWLKPWAVRGSISRPLRANGKPYTGVNVLMLWAAAEEKGYSSPYWMTFNQAKDLGGCVRKGEKASRVVYASTFEKTEENSKGEDVIKKIPFLKTYCVFNVEQIDGLPAKYAPKTPEAVNVGTRNDNVEAFVKATGAEVRTGGDAAYFDPKGDYVKIPAFDQFESSEAYYGTLLHELVHWTGSASRNAREFGKRFGDNAYAFEELVAELGSAFLCADLEVTPAPIPGHASYLAGWLKILKADKRAIFTAASAAQKACDYLHRNSTEIEEESAE